MIRLLVTVPQLQSTVSPYRELMAVARHLPKTDFRLTVCSLRANGVEETTPLLESLGVRVFVARFRPRGLSLQRFVSCLRDQKTIAREGPFDLQHSFDFTSSPLEALLARGMGRRFVFTQRNLNEGGHPSMLRVKARLAHGIVAITRAVGDLLASIGVSRSKVVQVGLGYEELPGADAAAGPDPAGRFILSVGQLGRRKRHEDAIEAFARLASRLPDLHLAIAGHTLDRAYESELRGLIRERGLESRVHLLGPRNDVMRLMRRAVCLLHCPSSEAAGWVIIEAMAAGLPIVASGVGGITELLEGGRNGLLVRPGDVGGFAEAVGRIIENPELAHSLSAAGRKAVEEKHSAAATVRRLADLYREVCAR